MTTSDVYVIWDSLKIFNPQTVTAFSNGRSIFKTQIRYGYDNGTISGAYANMTTPTVMLGQVASNSSGWLTFSFSLTGISGPRALTKQPQHLFFRLPFGFFTQKNEWTNHYPS